MWTTIVCINGEIDTSTPKTILTVCYIKTIFFIELMRCSFSRSMPQSQTPRLYHLIFHLQIFNLLLEITPQFNVLNLVNLNNSRIWSRPFLVKLIFNSCPNLVAFCNLGNFQINFITKLIKWVFPFFWQFQLQIIDEIISYPLSNF